MNQRNKAVACFRGENVYLLENIHELHTIIQWKKKSRDIKENEIPYKKINKKQIKSNFNNNNNNTFIYSKSNILSNMNDFLK